MTTAAVRSPATQEFMNIVFCLPIGQGYGATETCGAGTITHLHDVTVGTVGPPVACCHIRLVDVPEMGYQHTDRDEHTGQVAFHWVVFTRPWKNISKIQKVLPRVDGFFLQKTKTRYASCSEKLSK